MPSLHQIKSYTRYWLDAVDEHSLHSPFFFDLYTKVLRPKHPGEPGQATDTTAHAYEAIERLRHKLLHDERTIARSTFGAGSTVVTSTSPTISSIARTSLTPPRYLAAYARLVRHLSCTHIVELGTSFGISALYLAHTPGTSVTTFEGSSAIAGTAQATFDFAAAANIRLIEGNIDTTLPAWLQSTRTIDLAFIDANHRYEATMRYFSWLLPKLHGRSALIIDDIHYSAEMEQAWCDIKAPKLVYATADLYKSGIAFFDTSLTRQHFTLQF